MPYNLLSEPIRRYIRDKRWEELRPIQVAAITRILTTDNNYILASRTASGKTEAAFLPILSLVNFNEAGVQVLYISPLIALINDQLVRVEELCKYIDIPVTKWHGESKISDKNKIIKDPKGIILITPESLEAMFVTKPYNISRLFSSLKFVIIDEIHSFIGTDRGIQLKSILSRLQEKNKFRVIGLSATIGSYVDAKKITGDNGSTKVLLDKASKEIIANFFYFDAQNKADLPIDLLKNLYLNTHNNKVLIFPNSRGKVEEISVKLKKISDKIGGHGNYFSHHSSVNKGIREYVEFFAKNSKNVNFSISCTSTLELGIDIGSVDKIVQIDATQSVSSLIQRTGRGGRRNNEISQLLIYSTNPYSLLQSLACWTLHKEGFIDPPNVINKPYDILAHQLISVVKSHNGINSHELCRLLKNNFAFSEIEMDETVDIVDHLISIDIFEKINNEIIIGISGERIVNSMDFYSSFEKEINLKVIYNQQTIGEIQFSPQIEENQNILLAAKIWKIVEVDLNAGKVFVVTANDGKKPVFTGGFGHIHRSIRGKMLELLLSDEEFKELDENSSHVLRDLRKQFSLFNFDSYPNQRPLSITNDGVKLHLFSGTKETFALKYLFNQLNTTNNIVDSGCALEIHVDKESFIDKWNSLTLLIPGLDSLLLSSLNENSNLTNSSKWAWLLPEKYQISLLKEKNFDFEEAFNIVEKIKFVYCN